MGVIVYREESYAVQGAIFEVYKGMGSGFLESVYQECLEIELRTRGIPFAARMQLALHYKGRALERKYRADLVCYSCLLVELKAVRALTGEHRAQVINYLSATGMRLGLLVNFGSYPKVGIERLVL